MRCCGFLVDRRQEDDRDALGLLAFADDLGGFIAVHAGHVDVEKDDRELAACSNCRKASSPDLRDNDLADILEHSTDGEQILLVIVDDQDARRAIAEA